MMKLRTCLKIIGFAEHLEQFLSDLSKYNRKGIMRHTVCYASWRMFSSRNGTANDVPKIEKKMEVVQ